MNDVQKTDDRPVVPNDRKPLAGVRLDMELMNALTASQGRDNASLGELMIRHRGLVYNELRRWNIRRCDVDDVAGRVWDKVWRMSRTGAWNTKHARYSTDPFVPLLRKICRSRAIDFHRAASRQRRSEERMCDAARSFGADWREVLAGPRRWSGPATRPEPAGVPPQLTDAVARLPERLRMVFELHANGMTNRKISTEVGCSWGEVSRRLKGAREALGLPAKARIR